jgi:hypothetical protein
LWLRLDDRLDHSRRRNPGKAEGGLTPAELRAITISLNDERGTGGQTKLARLLGWHYSTLWRKLTGKSPITLADELAITGALGKHPGAST